MEQNVVTVHYYETEGVLQCYSSLQAIFMLPLYGSSFLHLTVL